MFTRKLQMPQHGMPAAEEFALWGARELSFEELLAVNGGKREKKEKPSGRSTSSGSSGGSSGSSHRRASSGTDSSTKDSSKSKEKKNKKSKIQTGSPAFDEKKSKPGTQSGTSSGNNLRSAERRDKEEKQNGSTDYTVQKGDTLSGIIRQRYPGASKEEIVRRVKEATAHSGITDINKIEPGQKIVFEKPEPAAERPNEGEKKTSTQGGGFPRGRRGRPSGGGGVSGSTGGSSGNSDSSGGGNTDSGGSARFNGRRNRGGDWQAGKNPRMPPGWGTKEKQHTEVQSDGQEGGTDFAAPQEKRGFLAGLKERFNRGSRDGASEGRNGLTERENLKELSELQNQFGFGKKSVKNTTSAESQITLPKKTEYIFNQGYSQLEFDKRYGFVPESDKDKTVSCKTVALINKTLPKHIVGDEQFYEILDNSVKIWKKSNWIKGDGSPRNLEAMSNSLSKEMQKKMFDGFVYPNAPESWKPKQMTPDAFFQSDYTEGIGLWKNGEQQHYMPVLKTESGIIVTDSMDIHRSSACLYELFSVEPFTQRKVY